MIYNWANLVVPEDDPDEVIVDVVADRLFQNDAAVRVQINDLVSGYIPTSIYQRPIPTLDQMCRLLDAVYASPPPPLVLPDWFPQEHRNWAEQWARTMGWGGVVYS